MSLGFTQRTGLQKKQLQTGDLRLSEIKDFLADRAAAGQTVGISLRAVTPVMSYLREVGIAVREPDCPAPGALTLIIERYRRYHHQ